MNQQKQPLTPAETRARIRRYYDSLQSRNYFQIFGADPDTDPERIKASYHLLAKQWHTDAYAGVDLGEERNTLEAVFKMITEAYDTITDPHKRGEYLVYLDRRSKGLSTDVNEILQGERLFDEAMVLIGRRDWEGARKKLEDGLKFNADDTLMNATFAWALFNATRKTKQADEEGKRAIEILKACVKKQENLAPGYQYLGQIYFTLERHDEAKKWWRKCLEWDPNNIEAARGVRLSSQRAETKSTGLGGFLDKLFGKKGPAKKDAPRKKK